MGMPTLPTMSADAARLRQAMSDAGAARRSGDLFDGVSLDRPLEMFPTFVGNLYHAVTGKDDPRMGKAITEVVLAGERLVTGGLRGIGNGNGVIAAGSGFLGRALPALGMGLGMMDVWKGWNELSSHEGGPLALMGSKTARSGLLGTFASATLFVPGPIPMIAGIGARLLAAANELDAFDFLDKPTRDVEADPRTARVLHPLDDTPHDPGDPSALQDAYSRYRQMRSATSVGQAVAGAMQTAVQ